MMMKTEIRPPIREYSMAVTPYSDFAKDLHHGAARAGHVSSTGQGIAPRSRSHAKGVFTGRLPGVGPAVIEVEAHEKQRRPTNARGFDRPPLSSPPLARRAVMTPNTARIPPPTISHGATAIISWEFGIWPFPPRVLSNPAPADPLGPLWRVGDRRRRRFRALAGRSTAPRWQAKINKVLRFHPMRNFSWAPLASASLPTVWAQNARMARLTFGRGAA